MWRRKRIETGIQAAVWDYWRWLRKPDTLVAAIPNAGAMGQPGLTPGLPDLLVIGPRVPNGIGFIELKTDDGPISDAQQNFHSLCTRLGIACAVTRGRDQPIAILKLWDVVKDNLNDVERAGARGSTRGKPRVEAG